MSLNSFESSTPNKFKTNNRTGVYKLINGNSIVSIIFVGLLINLIVFPFSTAGEADDNYLQIYTELYEPNSYIDSDTGAVTGYVTKFVREVLTEANMNYRIDIVPWVRAIHALDSTPNVMVYSMARTPERESKYHWVGKTLPLDFYLYGQKKDLAQLPRTFDDAINSRIAVVRADVVADFLESQQFQNLIYVRTPSLYLNMLERNRIDLFPFTELEIGFFARENGVDENSLIGVTKLEEVSKDQFIVMSKSTDVSVLKKLDDAYSRVVNSGKYDEIMNPFFNQLEHIKVDVLE